MARYDLIDWQDGVLRNNAWLLQQPAMSRGTNVVDTRLYPDPSTIQMDIAKGKGRFGRNALRITNKSVGSLPDFLIIARDKNHPRPGYGVARPGYSDGYLCPANFNAKKLHVIAKFPAGFRAAQAAATQTTSDENYHVGTFHFDPGQVPATGLSSGLKETNNWHHYHQLSVRHDLAKDGWIHMVCSPTPTHQRGGTGTTPAPEVTGAYGRYWDTAVSLYFAPVPYGRDNVEDPSTLVVDIPAPYETLIDSIYFTDDAEYQPVKIEFVGYRDGQEVEALANVPTKWYSVRLINNTDSIVSGRVVAHGAFIATNLRDANTQVNVQGATISLVPGEVRSLEVRGTPRSGNLLSVVFVPTREETRPRYGSDQIPSKQDAFVCYREVHGYLGPPDADVCRTGLQLRITTALSSTAKPWTRGGQKWHCEKNKPLTKQLDVDDPQGLPVTATLVDYDAVRKGQYVHTPGGGGALSISPSGLVSFMPLADFEGTVFFRYRISNGVRDGGVFGNWINVGKSTVAACSGNQLFVADGKLVTIA